MGVAILSGVLAGLDALRHGQTPAAVSESHTPGTLTPTIPQTDASQPSKFIACVTREETMKRLNQLFCSLGTSGPGVDVRTNQNVAAVSEAQVILLWYSPSLCTERR